MAYNHLEIEKKWKEIWLKRKEYRCDTSDFQNQNITH